MGITLSHEPSLVLFNSTIRPKLLLEYRSSNQEPVTITEPAISMEHFESPVEENNEVPTRSKRQRTAKSFGDDFLVYLIDDTPSSISEAYASEDADYWKEAVRSEMDSILANEIWEITDRPQTHLVVPYKFPRPTLHLGKQS